jgi:hypothetical protein
MLTHEFANVTVNLVHGQAATTKSPSYLPSHVQSASTLPADPDFVKVTEVQKRTKWARESCNMLRPYCTLRFP